MYIDDLLAKEDEFEGPIPWMYRDTRGYVTVGIGHMLSDSSFARALPFELADGSAASATQIWQDYVRVLALPMGRPAADYRAASSPVLSKAQMDALLATTMQANEASLRMHLAGYDSFADAAKMALLDMAYNLGTGGLLHKYPHLCTAAEAKAWTICAANCHRNGPSDARNDWTKTMFLQAAKG